MHALSTATLGISKEEATTIRLYTGDLLYPTLNRALRTQEAVNIQPWFPYLKLFHNAVKKLPTVAELFCRGESTDWIASKKAGSIVTWVNSSSHLHTFRRLHPQLSNSVTHRYPEAYPNDIDFQNRAI